MINLNPKLPQPKAPNKEIPIILRIRAAQRGVLAPSLDLNFARNKSLIDNVTGNNFITFTRASSGTFFDSNGVLQTASTDVPRFDHNPITGESLGLLVEEQRTNLCLQSADFDNASWNKFNTTVTANAVTAPDGTTTADLLVNVTGISLKALLPVTPPTITAGTVCTLSYYVKYNTNRYLQLVIDDAVTLNGVWTSFDLLNGTITQAATAYGTGASPASTITTVGNGWYRITLTGTAGTVATLPRILISPQPTGTSFFGNFSSTDSTYIWGAQFEVGSFASSYIPTTTAAVTRSADVASITGSNFSSWYNQTEGSFFCSTFAPKGTVIFGTGNTFDNTQYVTVAATNNVSIRSGGSDQAILTAPVSSSANTNIAFSYASNSFAALSNGGTLSTDTTGNVPAAQIRLKLGTSAWDAGSSNSLNGTISRLTYFRQRLSNEALQTITL